MSCDGISEDLSTSQHAHGAQLPQTCASVSLRLISAKQFLKCQVYCDRVIVPDSEAICKGFQTLELRGLGCVGSGKPHPTLLPQRRGRVSPWVLFEARMAQNIPALIIETKLQLPGSASRLSVMSDPGGTEERGGGALGGGVAVVALEGDHLVGG